MKLKDELIRFIKFNLVGVINTLVDMGIYWLLNGAFGMTIAPAQVISYSCGMLNSWLWNSRWTFKAKERTPVKGLRFVIVNLLSLLVSILILYFCKNTWGIEGILAKLISWPFSTAINFVGNRLFVFNQKDTKEGD